MEKGIKRIRLSRANIQKIAKAFECSETTVYNALKYRNNSYIQRRIRYVALKEYKGVILED